MQYYSIFSYSTSYSVLLHHITSHSQYDEFYKKNFNGRKLTWMYQLGTGLCYDLDLGVGSTTRDAVNTSALPSSRPESELLEQGVPDQHGLPPGVANALLQWRRIRRRPAFHSTSTARLHAAAVGRA